MVFQEPWPLQSHFIRLLPEKCHTTNIPSFELLDIFYNGVRLSVGLNVESSENVSVKCRPGFDPDIDYEGSYVMSCNHGNWSNGLTCTPSKLFSLCMLGIFFIYFFLQNLQKIFVSNQFECQIIWNHRWSPTFCRASFGSNLFAKVINGLQNSSLAG